MLNTLVLVYHNLKLSFISSKGQVTFNVVNLTSMRFHRVKGVRPLPVVKIKLSKNEASVPALCLGPVFECFKDHQIP